MKAKILLSFCCLCAITSFGQDSTYQLKDFKYRTPGYKALEFSISFNGSLADQKNVFADKSKAKNFQLYPSWIRYSKTVSTDSKLSTSTFTLNPVYGFSSNEVNSDVNKYRSGSGNFDWQFDNRFFRNDNWFWQLGNSVSIHGSFYRHSQISSMDKASLLEATDELILGFGKGRIEMVQDAQMALFILNDLREQGLVVQPDAATINSFARLITHLNNKRIFDFRRKRIYELTQIDSFLRENRLTNTTDIRHFTTINDNWAFGYNPLRSSGSNWFFHIVPFTGVNRDKGNTTGFNSYKTTVVNFGLRPEIGYESSRPLNLKWQRDMGSTFSWSYQRNHFTGKNSSGGITSESDTFSNVFKTILSAFYGLGYYPNNRSRINANLNVLASYLPYDHSPIKNEISFNPVFSLSTDYFISYRTRLSAYFSLIYEYDVFKQATQPSIRTHLMHAGFGMSVSHSFL